jgi:hypothetical protein
VWQRRGDAIWVYHGTGVIGSTDVLRVDDGELRGTRTYGTDTGAAYFATVWYHPAHCLGF